MLSLSAEIALTLSKITPEYKITVILFKTFEWLLLFYYALLKRRCYHKIVYILLKAFSMAKIVVRMVTWWFHFSNTGCSNPVIHPKKSKILFIYPKHNSTYITLLSFACTKNSTVVFKTHLKWSIFLFEKLLFLVIIRNFFFEWKIRVFFL